MKSTTTTNSQIRVFAVTSLEALEPYVELWDQLALHAPQRLPMLSAPWVMTYLEHSLGPHESWKCYLATTPDDQLVGILPLVVSPHRFWHTFFPTLRTPWDWHTRSGDLLAHPGMEPLIINAFLKALREDFGSRFMLEMKGIRANSPTLPVLNCSILGWVSWTKPEPPGAFLSVDGEFDVFQKKFSSEFKRQIRRKAQNLAQMPGYSLTFLKGQSIDMFSLERLFELEASGWKGKDETAIMCSAKLKAFYCKLAQRLIDRSWLELHFLQVDGKLVACHFAVRFGAALIIPKLAYDESYSKFSPGSVLFVRAIERAFEASDCHEFNMLSDANWYDRWKMEWGGYCQVYLFPKHIFPILLGLLPKIMRSRLSKIKWIRRISYHLSLLR